MKNILILLLILSANQALLAQCSVNFSTQQSPNDPMTYWFVPHITVADSSVLNAYSLVWDFGDNTNSTENAPMHQYNATGAYSVCLTVTFSNMLNCSSINLCNVLTIGSPINVNCDALFSYQSDANNPLSITFNNLSNIPPAAATAWLWDFGDGTTSNTFDASHTYTPPSDSTIYNVCLSVITGNDPATVCTDIYCTPVLFNIVQPDNCTANFSYQPAFAAPPGYPYIFSDASYSTYNISTWQWTFGDGTASNEQNPYHIFTADTTYQVCLTITATAPNNVLCEQTICQIIDSDPSTPASPVFGSICGMVVPNDINCICPMLEPMTIYLIEYNPQPGILTAIDSLVLDGTAQGFCFDSVPSGNYLLKAALHSTSPLYHNYLPSYYNNAVVWNLATSVSLADSSLVLFMQAGEYAGGTGFIGGNISDGAGKTDALLPNITVLLMDNNGTPIGFTYTDSEGNYSFPNIAFGTYQIWVDIAGLNTTPQTISVSANAPSANNIDFVVLATQIEIATAAISELIVEPFSMAISPTIVTNTGELRLNCAISYSDLNIVIINGAGIPVWGQSGSFAQGNHSVSINASRWVSGLYTVMAYSGGIFIGSEKFVKF